MSELRAALHAKRSVTDEHIRQLEKEGRAGIRYTAMIPDVPWLVLGLLSDVGWLMHLIAGIIYFKNVGIRQFWDVPALIALILMMFGVGYIIYLNRIHEKEIATKLQKDLGFGLTVFGGLAGATIGFLQMRGFDAAPVFLYWIIAGGLLNFITGAPIYFSFRKGITYGVQ